MTIKQFSNSNKTNITHLTNKTEWKIYNTFATVKKIVTSDDYYW